MRLHLDLDIKPAPVPIRHEQKLLLMGSCFTEHMGQRLEAMKFDCHLNPFGITFSPESLLRHLRRILKNEAFTEADLMQGADHWFAPDAHSSLSDTTSEGLLSRLNAQLHNWHHHLHTASWLILTFGSAYAYWHRERQHVVANCHKLPANHFTKRLADPEVLATSYSELIDELRAFNPKLRLILTVSPVKHLRDGVVENNLSKAILCLTAHKLVQSAGHCTYFPAYELVNDDLRDYRFYETDMAHPNHQAIDYVWEKFSKTYFDQSTQALLQQLSALRAALLHRPLHPNTRAYAEFKAHQLNTCRALASRYPFLDFQTEIAHFSAP